MTTTQDKIRVIEERRAEELGALAKKKNQIVARAQQRIARLRTAEDKKRTRQLIVIGGIVAAAIEKNPQAAQAILNMVPEKMRAQDEKAIGPILESWRAGLAE